MLVATNAFTLAPAGLVAEVIWHISSATPFVCNPILTPRCRRRSDDGSLFIWCRKSGNIVRCLRGDDSILNCVQLHPSTCLLATSGIETVVRLWSPRPEVALQTADLLIKA